MNSKTRNILLICVVVMLFGLVIAGILVYAPSIIQHIMGGAK